MGGNWNKYPRVILFWWNLLSIFYHRVRKSPAHWENRWDEYRLSFYTSGCGTIFTRFCPWVTSYITMPSATANKVSSLPAITLRPGLIFVPRWRTRILPDNTN